MKRLSACAVFFIILTGYNNAIPSGNPFPVAPWALSASGSEGPFSSMINPVFTDVNPRNGIAYRFLEYNGAGSTNHFVAADIFGFETVFSRYSYIPDDRDKELIHPDTSLWSINRGFFFGNTFGIGAGYTFSTGGRNGFNSYTAWNIGFLYRPFHFISLAVVFRDLGAEVSGDRIGHTDVYSLSVRPFGERLTLSADRIISHNTLYDRSCYSYSCSLNIYGDISVTAKYSADRSFFAGLTMPLFIRGGENICITPDAGASFNGGASNFKTAGIAVISGRDSRAVQIKASETVLDIRIDDRLISGGGGGGLFEKKHPGIRDLIIMINEAKNDSTISAIFLEIDNAGMGFAQLQELRDALQAFRSSGKKVYSLIKHNGNREYYLATASDRIYFTPNSTFALTGLSIRTYYIKGLLDMTGIKYESFAKGKYKSFNEMFVRKNMSDESRENMRNIIEDLSEQYIGGITDGRHISRGTLEKLFTAGYYTPEEAREEGFIDGVMYREQAVSSISSMHGRASFIPFDDYFEEEEPVRIWGPVPAIAIINIKGAIIPGRGSAFTASSGEEDYRNAIETAFSDPSVRGVVIRIDSGGGSAEASDYIWSYIIAAKKKYLKPVVFSFGNTAASGGYYIACTGDRIFAEKGSITGSIGVVAGKISLEELYSKIGISTETIKTSEFADVFSESRSLTGKERSLMMKNIEFIYDRFTGKVLEGRKIPAAKIPEIAEGRIHTGRSALESGLIDETGGLLAAIEWIKNRTSIGDEFRIIDLPSENSLLKSIMYGNATADILARFRFFTENIDKYRLLDGEALYLQPCTIEIE